ncbi:MAG: stage II sporulation protein R [Eubacteriales bacterium]|nr:stage II sporulation protein R [Eubacteriales bacterium]MDD3873438.1 stage II sporulation protein R [Methanosarcina sp.]MDD4583120.1 stage II sporulation protein R [Eubacteriales bacterium]
MLKRKQIRAVLLIIISVFAYNIWVSHKGELLSNEDFIRFHVIANSNSKADQALKLKVRDGLLEHISEGLVTETLATVDKNQTKASLDIEKTRTYIEKNLEYIESTAEAIVAEEGYPYPVKADLGVSWIPEKTYGNLTFPAGNYQALNVIIGEGNGENWWCVLFPPLCLIGTEENAILDKKYQELLDSSKEPKTIQLKFKTLELIKK